MTNTFIFIRISSLANFTAPNRQSPSVKSMDNSIDHVFNSWTVKSFTTFLWLKDVIFCFKQMASNFTIIFALGKKINFRVRLLLDVAWVLMLSFHYPLNFYAKILSLLAGAVKAAVALNTFVIHIIEVPSTIKITQISLKLFFTFSLF